MEKLEGNNIQQLAGLFPEYTWNYIVDTIIEGWVGETWVNDVENPKVVELVLPEHKIHIMGGDTEHPSARICLADLSGFTFLIFGSPGWKALLDDVQPGKIITLQRYPFSSESLDVDHLTDIKTQLSDEFTIERIDLAKAQKITNDKNDVTEDHLFGFTSPEDFIERGFGYCVLDGEEFVCIASTGAMCARGAEIQVNTHRKYRGKGLASAVSAALILECLEKGIDPNWDAATEVSAGLAKKLGYTPQGEYDMYFYTGSRFLVKLRNFLRRIRGKEI